MRVRYKPKKLQTLLCIQEPTVSTRKRKCSSLLSEEGMSPITEPASAVLCSGPDWCGTILFSFLAVDEESSIEEQEAAEQEADHKAELADLNKDGTTGPFFCL